MVICVIEQTVNSLNTHAQMMSDLVFGFLMIILVHHLFNTSVNQYMQIIAVHHRSFCLKCEVISCSKMAAVNLLILSCCLLMLSGFSDGRDFLQAVYQAKPLSSSQCGYYEDDEQLMETIKIVQQLICNPPRACIDILSCNSFASSGY